MKPKLFIDVDGVVLASYGYGNHTSYQIRPYVGSFLIWAYQHFDLYWLTCHGSDSTAQISQLCGILQAKMGEVIPSSIPHITYLPWRNYDKEREDYTGINLDKLQAVLDLSKDQPWLVIEDNYPCYEGYKAVMANLNWKQQWVIVPSEGADVFIPLQKMLEDYLSSQKINPPWKQPPVDEAVLQEGLHILSKL